MADRQISEYNVTPHFRAVDEIRKNWSWFFVLGLVLIALGALAIGAAYYTTVFSVILFGVVLVVAGIVQIVQGCLARRWTGVAVGLLLGILYLATGFISLVRPEVAAVALTLWIAAFCLVAGLFRIFTSVIQRYEHWGWVFFNGLVTFLLGGFILADWPISGLWVIGLFVGIDLLLAGWTWLLLSLAAKKG